MSPLFGLLLLAGTELNSDNKQFNYICSGASRFGTSMREHRRCPDGPIDSWWRRLHRDGKKFLTKHSVEVVNAVKSAKFRFAGHIARFSESDIVHRVLKVRHLAWWRAKQAQIHANRGPRPHDSRFNAPHRWEGPLNTNQKLERYLASTMTLCSTMKISCRCFCRAMVPQILRCCESESDRSPVLAQLVVSKDDESSLLQTVTHKSWTIRDRFGGPQPPKDTWQSISVSGAAHTDKTNLAV